ncbi:MAG: DNA polymerase I [Bacteroidia bacterium]|nr:DNA polymerase I [Bacteroidia bacterium]
MNRLFLLDAYALIYRSYFAFINAPRINSKGLNTSAMFGFVNTLEQLLKTEKPTHIAIAFDMKGPTFRHDMFPDYKANRDEMPEDLRKSIPYIRDIIKGYQIPILEKAGFEADDVIGTLAKVAEKKGFQVFMVTPDKDYAQLVSPNIFMYKPKRMGNEMEILGVEQVCENFQIQNPLQVIDILGLMGDASDNIPGCPGIGPKTAMKLVGEFGGIDGVYQNLEQLKGKQKESLATFEEQVRLSRKLAEIILDVPVEFNQEDLLLSIPDTAKLRELFLELEFRTMAEKLGSAAAKPIEAAPLAFAQGTLFSEVEQTLPESYSEQSNLNSTDHHYVLINSEEKIKELVGTLSLQKAFCFDTETTGLDTQLDQLVGLSFSFKAKEGYYVPIPFEQDEALKRVSLFKELFATADILKIGQNMKFDILMLTRYGIEIKGEYFDTMVAHYLIQPDLRHNLDYLSDVYLNYKKVATEELIGKRGKNQLSMRDVELEQIKEYACEDADITFQLKKILDQELSSANLKELFATVEMPLLKVLVQMEISGLTIDPKALDDYAIILREQINELENAIIELAGEPFNISSPKQLGTILFEKLLLDPKAKKTKTKQYSTGEEILVNLQDKHPIVNKILEYRGLKKLLSTYVEALPKLINPKTGKIHSSFNQTIAATGRLSSTNPNLQNIPIRDESGREIRKAFIPSDSDHLFLSADYSQIELRIMAAVSGDKVMTDAFQNGEDIHAATAAKIFDVKLTDVTSEMRRKAKTANFGILYGISAFGLSQRLQISRAEAKKLIDDYYANFSTIKNYMDTQLDLARERGFVETIMGRKRYLSDINSANATIRSFAERNAINAPIQGSAADIIKVAMINIYKRFEEQNLSSRMILQVHDELNFDVLKTELEVVKEIIKTEMEQAIKLTVPLEIELKAAENWLLAH